MTVIDQSTGTGLRSRFEHVRSETEALAAPLTPEDQQVQSMPDVSPTKWHRAHTTWFFETFLLRPSLPGYREHHPGYGYLFNSYYEAVGPRHTRADRGLISRPTSDEVAAYRRHVDEAMAELIDLVEDGRRPELAELITLGLHHEQQHQELLLMDIKHVLSVNPLRPAYRAETVLPGTDPGPVGWVAHEGGIVTIGHDGAGFAFDNEGPRHDVLLRPFVLADRLVTAGEWLDFQSDGGYERPELWLSDGWHTVQQEGWDAPLYWFRDGGEWWIHTLTGVRRVDPAEPVVHVSGYEADAFATWAGARLPLEAEWELAAASVPVEGNLLPTDHLHPAPATGGHVAGGPRQMIGDVWEWTASPYVAYPGFRAAEGAVGEYNGKFMSNQTVLRGGCAVTPGGHVRRTYRNFFPPHARWAFGGLRLAKDADA